MLALLALAVSWTSLAGPDGRLSREVAAAIDATGPHSPRTAHGRIVGAAPGMRVMAVPIGLRIFEQDAALKAAPPAITVMAPSWELLPPSALAVGRVEATGAFEITLDERPWSIAACDDSGWCSEPQIVMPAARSVDLRPREVRFAAIEVADDTGAKLGAEPVRLAEPTLSPWSPPGETASGVTDSSGRVLVAGLRSGRMRAFAGRTSAMPGKGLLRLIRPRLGRLLVVAEGVDPMKPLTWDVNVFHENEDGWTTNQDFHDQRFARSELPCVEPGRLMVRVVAEGYLPATSDPVVLAPAGEATVRMKLERGLSVSGIVRDAATHAPFPAALVWAGMQRAISSDERGVFHVALPRGEWTVAAAASETARSSSTVVRLDDRSVDGLVLDIERPGSVRVHVKDSGGDVAGVALELTPSGFMPLDRVTDFFGSAVFESVPVGAGTLRIVGQDATHVSIESGNERLVEVTFAGVTASDQETPDGAPFTPMGPGDLAVRRRRLPDGPGMATFKGLLADETTHEPVPAWYVHAVGIGVARADSSGRFEIALPSSGEIELVPSESADAIDPLQPRTRFVMAGGRPSPPTTGISVRTGPLTTVRVPGRSGEILRAWRRLAPGFEAREDAILSDPSGVFTLRGIHEGDEILVTDDASFMTCMPVAAAAAGLIDVTPPDAGALLVRASDDDAFLELAGCHSRIGVTAWAGSLRHFEPPLGSNVITLLGIPVGDVEVTDGEHSRTVHVSAGRTTEVDLR